MQFSRAILGACLVALKWMLWLVAGLLLVLIAARSLRGEELDVPPLLVLVAVSAVGGWLLGRFANWFERKLG